MNFETKRLILRPWQETDASALYTWASSPLIGPSAGWPAHTSVEDSQNIIKNVLAVPDTYAVVLKESNTPIGSISLMFGNTGNLELKENEAELGYWIAVPYWGKGLIPEAAEALIQYAFGTLNLSKIWCGYFDGNEQSRRVQEKCGFKYHHTNKNVPVKLLNTTKTIHISCLEKPRDKDI